MPPSISKGTVHFSKMIPICKKSKRIGVAFFMQSDGFSLVHRDAFQKAFREKIITLFFVMGLLRLWFGDDFETGRRR